MTNRAMVRTQIKCKNPIFIIGCPRSGTTVLASILNRHSQIASATETHFFNFIAKNNYKWDDFDLNAFKRFLEESRITDFTNLLQADSVSLIDKFTNYKTTEDETLLESNEFHKKQVFDILMNTLLEKRHKKRFCEKTPQHLNNVNEILKLYPQAKFVHLVRDGRDTVNSLLKMPWRPDGLVNNARFWIQYIKLGQELNKQAEALVNNLLTVKYENLLKQPNETIKLICEFIDEKFEPQMLQESQADIEIFSPWESTWKHKSSQDLDASRIGAWSRELSMDDQIILNYLLRKELLALSYPVPELQLNLRQRFKIATEYADIAWRKIVRTVFHVIN